MLQQIMAKLISSGPLMAPFVYCIEDSIKNTDAEIGMNITQHT